MLLETKAVADNRAIHGKHFFLILILQLNYQSNLNTIKTYKREIIAQIPTLKPLRTSNHYFLQAKALPSHPHPDSSLTQMSKEKQSCLNEIAFKSYVYRITAKFSLKQGTYSFSGLQDRETEEQSTGTGTYQVSSRSHNPR